MQFPPPAHVNSIVAHWKKEEEKVTLNPRILKAPKKD
jgi:hypothetical protein